MFIQVIVGYVRNVNFMVGCDVYLFSLSGSNERYECFVVNMLKEFDFLEIKQVYKCIKVMYGGK